MRESICYLSQNNFLNGTILEALMEDIKSNEQVIEICKHLGAHQFILNLPKGYQTLVEELNETQQQMINVIKAYHKQATILLADEPTDCFDSIDQESIIDFLLENSNHQIKIVILHNKEYISKFNRVFVTNNHSIEAYSREEYLNLLDTRK